MIYFRIAVCEKFPDCCLVFKYIFFNVLHHLGRINETYDHINRKGVYFTKFMSYSTQSLHAIIFVSSATENFGGDKLLELLQPLRENRQLKNLTSLVVYANGNALSLIEGEREVVEKEYEMLKSYPAHHDLIKLYDKPIVHRYFENYSLAFKSIGNPSLKAIDDFNTGENKDYWDECLSLTDDQIIKIITDFIKNNS
ncbi:MAG: hypothetical protein JWN56_1209 [Sphingobacteriales bacterium]|nr:hypothetical protein [Sphingobacteriales bacterium]